MTLDITSPLNAPSHISRVPASAAATKSGNAEDEVSTVMCGVADPAQGAAPAQGLSGAPSSDETDPQRRELTKAVGQLQEFVQSMKRNLEFSVDSDSGQMVIKVVDSETDQLIRQIPPEEVLRFTRHLSEQQGSLIRLKV